MVLIYVFLEYIAPCRIFKLETPKKNLCWKLVPFLKENTALNQHGIQKQQGKNTFGCFENEFENDMKLKMKYYVTWKEMKWNKNSENENEFENEMKMKMKLKMKMKWKQWKWNENSENENELENEIKLKMKIKMKM